MLKASGFDGEERFGLKELLGASQESSPHCEHDQDVPQCSSQKAKEHRDGGSQRKNIEPAGSKVPYLQQPEDRYEAQYIGQEKNQRYQGSPVT